MRIGSDVYFVYLGVRKEKVKTGPHSYTDRFFDEYEVESGELMGFADTYVLVKEEFIDHSWKGFPVYSVYMIPFCDLFTEIESAQHRADELNREHGYGVDI